MFWDNTAKIIVLICTFLIIAWDVIAANSGHSEASISSFLLAKTKAYPIIAFALGVLCGHLFWPNP